MISALHKCLRGSDGSAAMYWLARMITGGEDALYIARRLVVVASEDVGLGDNHALPLVRYPQSCLSSPIDGPARRWQPTRLARSLVFPNAGSTSLCALVLPLPLSG